MSCVWMKAYAWVSGSSLSRESDMDHDTAELVKELFIARSASMNSSRVLRGSRGEERPSPRSVMVGMRRPKLP